MVILGQRQRQAGPQVTGGEGQEKQWEHSGLKSLEDAAAIQVSASTLECTSPGWQEGAPRLTLCKPPIHGTNKNSKPGAKPGLMEISSRKQAQGEEQQRTRRERRASGG